jgi:hypothetical protein
MTAAVILAVVAAVILAAAGYIWTAGISKKLEERTAQHAADAERERTDAARHETWLHRQRFTEVWNWQDSEPPGEERAQSARWFGEWTGASLPYRGGKDSPPQTPGLHSASADDAYQRYLEFLGAQYEPGPLGTPREPW